MALIDLDHVNIRTARLAEMRRFYGRVLGLEEGPRPPFRVGGAWLYCGPRAAVHLVEVDEPLEVPKPRIEHFAFQAEGLADFLERLQDYGVAYRISTVPGLETRQVNIYDPDGNHIEIAFVARERADLSDYPGEG
ncbi:MAG: VOC family protein [Rhodospirillales bacterium]|nr:VOC family protein [Rhodospirillales bacterium]